MKARYKISCAVAAILTGCSGVAVAADDAGAAASTTAVQEVVVTAQRREQTIQSVPFTVQAFSGEAISKLNITTLDEILRYTPNVVYSAPGAGQGQVYMRGLSTGRAGEQSYATVGGFPNVAVYLDEQSMQFPGRSPDIFLADMQRVEVLEGPQGTLFGGGAEAGALRYITNKPKINVYEGSISGLYGFTEHGDNNWNGTAVINLPLVTDKLAVRAVAYNDRQGGYIDNVPSTFTRNEQLDNNTYIGVFRPRGNARTAARRTPTPVSACRPIRLRPTTTPWRRRRRTPSPPRARGSRPFGTLPRTGIC